MERVIRAAMAAAGLLVVVATDARAESADITPEHWKTLVKAVRTVKREYVAPVDDQRLGQACTERVHAMPALRQSPPLSPVTKLGDVPVALRAAAAMPGVTARRLHYYYSVRVGEAARPGVEPARSLSLWFWNDRLVAFTSSC
jgi:hypothetical protein